MARRTAKSERAGRYAALLTAVSAPLWWASQEARMYTLLALLIVVCALAWWIADVSSAPRGLDCALAGELALLYAHNTGPVAVIWLKSSLLIVAVVVWLQTRHLPRIAWRIWLDRSMCRWAVVGCRISFSAICCCKLQTAP